MRRRGAAARRSSCPRGRLQVYGAGERYRDAYTPAEIEIVAEQLQLGAREALREPEKALAQRLAGQHQPGIKLDNCRACAASGASEQHIEHVCIVIDAHRAEVGAEIAAHGVL